MIVHISNEQEDLKFTLDQVELIVRQVIQEENQACDEASIYFVDVKSISELHERFFDDPSPTDCISFPMDEEEDEFNLDYRVLGEVFVCPQTAIEYGKAHQIDPYEETTLYIVHGLLHLMGYRDVEDKDIESMRAAEKHHMSKLKELNLYLQPVT